MQVPRPRERRGASGVQGRRPGTDCAGARWEDPGAGHARGGNALGRLPRPGASYPAPPGASGTAISPQAGLPAKHGLRYDPGQASCGPGADAIRWFGAPQWLAQRRRSPSSLNQSLRPGPFGSWPIGSSCPSGAARTASTSASETGSLWTAPRGAAQPPSRSPPRRPDTDAAAPAQAAADGFQRHPLAVLASRTRTAGSPPRPPAAGLARRVQPACR